MNNNFNKITSAITASAIVVILVLVMINIIHINSNGELKGSLVDVWNGLTLRQESEGSLQQEEIRVENNNIERMSNLQQQVDILRERGIETISNETIREIEVSKETKLQTIEKNIVNQQYVTIDDQDLQTLKDQIASLMSYSQTPNSPVYINNSSGINVGGHGTFSSLGVSGPLTSNGLSVNGSVNFVPSSRSGESGSTFTVAMPSTFEQTTVFNNTVTLSGGLTGATDILTTTTQLTLSYDDSNYTYFFTDSNGDMHLEPSGGDTYVTGNLFADDSTFYVDSINNRVGIGTITPGVLDPSGKEVRLEMTGSLVLSPYGATNVTEEPAFIIRARNTDNSYAEKTIFQVQGADGDGAQMYLNENGSAAFFFDTRSDRDSFINAGDFGIGTTSPEYLLDVQGASGIEATYIRTNGRMETNGVWVGSDGTRFIGSPDSEAFLGIWAGGGWKFAVDNTTGYVGIGDTSPDYKLEVLDTATQMTLTYADGSTYTEMFTDVNGDLHIEPSGGDVSIAAGTLKMNNMQVINLADQSAYAGSIFIGNGGGSNTGAANTSLGIGSMISITSGNKNTAVGWESAKSVTTGTKNVFLGRLSGWSTTTGGGNIAIGSDSYTYATTSINNVAIGKASLAGMNGVGAGDNNVVVGDNAGRYGGSVSEYTGNVIIGALADYRNNGNDGGVGNTLIGYQAGYGDVDHDKSGNIFIGYQAGWHDESNNRLYIENSNSTSPLIYGEFDSNIIDINGSLGVRDSSPDAALEVVTSGTSFMISSAAANDGDIFIVDSSGNVGIGTTGPGSLLQLGAGSLSWATGGGAITHILGPTDQALKISGGAGSTGGAVTLIGGPGTGSDGGNANILGGAAGQGGGCRKRIYYRRNND